MDLKESIVSSKKMKNYLETKGEKHTYYKHYCGSDKVVSILDKTSLFLSDGASWNDIIDRQVFNPSNSDISRFGLCTSYSKAENVAMWMLYSREDGMMIDLKPIINSCLKQKTVFCGNYVRNEGYKFETEFAVNDFKIYLADMVYYGETKKDDPNLYYIKRGDEIADCSRNIINNMGCYRKTLPWLYEGECRIIVEINKEIVGKHNTVRVPFDSGLIDNLKKKIFHSPNHTGNCTYQKSALTGKINWK